MPNLDLVIRSERVVREDTIDALDVGIAEGRIAVIAGHGTLSGRRVVDAGDHFVLPGSIDTHTHIEYPVGSDDHSLDSFETATRQAAISGTTTVIDFVPPSHGDHLAAALARLRAAEGRCAIDYGFHPILTDADEHTLADIPRLIALGLSSFKIYTTFEEMRLTDGQIYDAMKTIAGAGGLPGFHAEDHELVEHVTDAVARAGSTDASTFPGSRPQLAEVSAIGRAVTYAHELGSPLFVFHVSGAQGVAAIAHARSLGVAVRAETCTHYLHFTEDMYRGPDGWKYVITPPLRAETDRDALWRALGRGELHAVGSDHCAYSLEQKRPGLEDFRLMPAGAPGIDRRVPTVWSDAAANHRLTPTQFARVMATEPAKTFGLYPRKGLIRVGADADLIVLDPDRSWRATPDHWGSDYDIYDGQEGIGAVTLTVSGGRVVAEGGEYTGGLDGRLVKRRIDTGWW